MPSLLRAASAAIALFFGASLMITPATAAQPTAAPSAPIHASSKSVSIDGLDIAYREAGPKNAPVVLLLHGFPSSSHMYRDLIPQLATHYRVIAPDYPGFGASSAPATDAHPYTFAGLADVVDRFTDAVGAKSYVLFMQDYGGPIGFRLAVKHPERVRGLVIQNAVASVESWNPDVVAQIGPYWADRNPQTEAAVRALLKPETTKFQYIHGATRLDRVSPDAWIHDQAGLDRPGNDAVQLDLLYDYRNNVGQYPVWKSYLETRRPPTLIVWGKNDPFFTEKGVDYFKGLVPAARVQIYDAGHFALETHVDEIAAATLGFLDAIPR